MTIEVDDIAQFCNLPDEELKVRRAQVNQDLFRFVRRRVEQPSGLVLYFDESPEMRGKLDAFVAAERVCCSGIDWSVDQEAGALRLAINGIDPKSAAFASVGQGAAHRPDLAKPHSGRRFLRTLGLGTMGALLVCCALPLGAAALGVAMPVLLLDDPWLIAGVAFGLTGFMWSWQGRRKNRSAEAEPASGCGC